VTISKPLLALAAAMLFASSASAQNFTIADIIVDGYQRITPGIIYNLLPVGIGDQVDSRTAAQIIRALAASEYFDSVEVSREGDILIIAVQERPSVAEIRIDGNSVLETEDIIENMATANIAEGEIFTRAALEAIRQGIQEVYSSRGRYGAAVDIEVEELPRNRVSISLDIDEGEESRIRQINIVGNRSFDDETLLDLFELGPKPWYRFLSRRDRYSREQFSGDLERLESFYLDNGYVEFSIESTPISITPDRREVYITINVRESNQYVVNDVDLAGDLVDAEAILRSAIYLRPGQIYSQALVTGTEEIMVQFLGNLGYAFAEATGVPSVNDDGSVDVTFVIEPGNRTYVNRINFNGNVSTADDVLRREMRQLEAAPASSLQIEQSKVRLERLGYFETVEVATEVVPGSTDQIDVNFDVVEQNFGAVSLQVGTGGSGDFFLSGNLQAQNFLGTGRTVAVGLNRSRFITSFNFQYIDPYFTPDGVSRGVSMYVQEIDSPFNVANFNTSSYGASVSFSYPLSEVSGLGFDIGINHTELNSGTGSVQEIVSSPKLFPGVDRYLISPANPNPSSGPVTDTVFGDVNDLSIEQLRANPDPGFIDLYGDSFDNLSVSGNWYHNTLNRGQLANDGTFHNLGVEVTLPGSDLQFARFSYSSQFYWPLNWERTWVLGLRSNIGYGIGYGNTKQMPFFNHYFAGGLNAAGVVRGFEENSLGPRSTAGARYLTETATALLKDESGNILLKPDGSAEGVEELLVYRTEPLLDAMGQPVLDGLGNPLPALAVEDFFLHEDYDSFGGNILTAATLELLFPVPFVDEVSNQLRTSLFIDAGNVFSSHCTERQRVLQDCSDFDLGQLRYSVGLAVTYLSPFGPLTFYLAQPFGKDGDDTKSFDFTVGTGF